MKPPKKKFKGVELERLHQHVRLATPYLFQDGHKEVQYLKSLSGYSASDLKKMEVAIDEYFRVCMEAHWATCGSFIPTDVDNGIRLNLWKENLNPKQLKTFFDLTEASLKWDYRPVTAKIVNSSLGIVSTHEGTWFAVAVAAYAKACAIKDQAMIQKFYDLIWEEVKREEQISLEIYKSGDTITFLKLCALVAHNLGDLDRVFEMWNIPDEDRLKKAVYKASQQQKENFSSIFQGIYWVNRMFMAPENHRHFVLRQLKPIRKSADLMLPLSPFLDAWGTGIATHPDLSDEERTEILLALMEGLEKMPSTFAYARAIAGMIKGAKGGLELYRRHVPRERLIEFKSLALNMKVSVETAPFEEGFTQQVRKSIEGEFKSHFNAL